tara:strand:- start:259 stop:459 length:201 start_codon:yes stop_codon:yes gene_type:complete
LFGKNTEVNLPIRSFSTVLVKRNEERILPKSMEIYQNSKKGGRKQGHESEACTLPAQSGGGGGGMI